MTRRTLLLLFVILNTASADGPVYSRFGIGDLIWFGSSRALALGGLGFALRGEGFVNGANPAGLSGIRFTRFDASYSLSSFSSRLAEASAPYTMSSLQNIAVAVPIDTSRGVVLGIETAPYSLVSYIARRRDDQEGVTSDQTFFGRGGLSTFSLAVSVAATDRVHAGVRASYLFGRLRQFTSIEFDNTRFTDDAIDRSTYYRGFLLTAGTVVDVGSQLFGLNLPGDLSFGLALTLPSSPTGERFNAYRVIDTVITSTYAADVPMRVGIGGRLAFTDRTTLIADVAFQDWSGIATEAPGSLRSALRASAGYEILPRDGAQTFFGLLAYRFGAGYQQSYLSVGGTGIDELFGTAGLSFPIGPGGRLNTTLTAGVRGTTASGLQRDTYVQFSVGFTGSEVWFMSFREE